MITETQHESKRKLLEAAFEVVRAKGYTATRVEDICEAAGVTKGSFFYHFKSKEDLGLQAAEHWSAVTSELFREAPYHLPGDPLDRLLAYVDFRKALLKGELPQYTCLVGTMVQEVYGTWPAIREACKASICGHAETLEPDIDAAMEKYGVRGEWTALSLALHTQAVIQGSFILAKAQGGAEVAAESLDHLRRYLELLFGRTARSAEIRAQGAESKIQTTEHRAEGTENGAEGTNGIAKGEKEEGSHRPGKSTQSQPQEERTMAITQEVRLTETADSKEWPAMHYVFVERVGNISRNAPQAWAELHRLVPEIEENNQVTGYMSLYHMEDSVYRAGVRVAEKPVNLPEGMCYEKYAGGKFHRFVLTGPFSDLPRATGLAVERAREQKLALRDDFNIENYVTDPRVTPENEQITEILFPAG
jgi:TetR/AcrR family transcriptional regulator, transcriptional repressor for nem operon